MAKNNRMVPLHHAAALSLWIFNLDDHGDNERRRQYQGLYRNLRGRVVNRSGNSSSVLFYRFYRISGNVLVFFKIRKITSIDVILPSWFYFTTQKKNPAVFF